MTYAITGTTSRAEVALQVVQTGAAARTGSAATASTAAFRSPDPRSGRSFTTGAADAILSLVHARSEAQARAQVALGQNSAHAEAEAQASGGGSASAEARAWSSSAGQSQTTVTVSIEVQTFSITAQRPPELVGSWFWEHDYGSDARKFLDTIYNRLGETSDTPRTLDEWRTRVGFSTLSPGTLYGIAASSSTGQFTEVERRAAQEVWDQGIWAQQFGGPGGWAKPPSPSDPK
jgi:hypothetical protein